MTAAVERRRNKVLGPPEHTLGPVGQLAPGDLMIFVGLTHV
jgi:hypothetical protein